MTKTKSDKNHHIDEVHATMESMGEAVKNADSQSFIAALNELHGIIEKCEFERREDVMNVVYPQLMEFKKRMESQQSGIEDYVFDKKNKSEANNAYKRY